MAVALRVLDRLPNADPIKLRNPLVKIALALLVIPVKTKLAILVREKPAKVAILGAPLMIVNAPIFVYRVNQILVQMQTAHQAEVVMLDVLLIQQQLAAVSRCA